MPSSAYRTPWGSWKGLLLYLGLGITLGALGLAAFLASRDDRGPAPGAETPGAMPAGETRVGVVQGCNTYGENCGSNPIYEDVPPVNYDWTTEPKITTVSDGSELEARCWEIGGTTWNYAALATPPDHGPDPYASDVVFNVRVPDGDEWGWIPDTYFVRDSAGRLGLPKCSELAGMPA